MSNLTIISGFNNNSAPIINVGVYYFDGNYTYTDRNLGGKLRAIPCSCRHLTSKMLAGDCFDQVIVYPGFKVIFYSNIDYNLQNCVIDNTYTNKIITRQMISINAIDSCKIYYQGTEIVLNGISNNTDPTMIGKNKTETFTGNSSVIT